MATPPFQLDLDATNPYRLTQLYVKNGRAFWGIWQAPDIQLDGDEEHVTVRQGMEGQLDLFAERVYGRGFRTLWRAIAHVNKIDYPLRDVKAGMDIVIPKFAHVMSALQAGSSGTGRLA